MEGTNGKKEGRKEKRKKGTNGSKEERNVERMDRWKVRK